MGDVGRILPILTAQIADNPRTDWCNTIETLRRDWQERMAVETGCDRGPISPQFLVRTLQDAVDPHAVIALDVGDHFVWFTRVRSVGCLGRRVEHPAELAGALREVLDANKPVLVDVLTTNVIPPGTKP
ncbi:MAG: hypothetical protein ACYDDN_03245 [Candidatus Desulforudaceae bacterium]|nr:hypothetical protein [Eubacteriales bacterium]